MPFSRVSVLSIFLILVVVGCVAPIFLESTASDAFYYNDHRVVLSRADSSTVAVYGIMTRQELIFHIACINNSSHWMDIIPEKIRITAFGSTGDRLQAEPFSANVYMLRMRMVQGIGLALVGVAGAVNAQLEGDPVAQALREGQSQAQMEQLAANEAAYSMAVERGLLRRNTVFPQQVVEGNIMVGYEWAFRDRFEIIVPFGEEEHLFTFFGDR